MNKVAEMLLDYASGMTVKKISDKYGMATGKAFYMLRDAGCEFRSTGVPIGYKHTQEFCENISRTHKGKTVSEKTRKAISEKKSSIYNGLNGWGHTKPHNRGYVRAYAPLHPHVAKDGYVMLHTVVYEHHIGRYLEDDECVHHVNHIRDDNRIDNLRLMKKHDHRSMHMKERWIERRRLLLTA